MQYLENSWWCYLATIANYYSLLWGSTVGCFSDSLAYRLIPEIPKFRFKNPGISGLKKWRNSRKSEIRESGIAVTTTNNYIVRHKNCTLLTGTITFAKLCHTVMIFGTSTQEYPIACLFDSLCKTENWEPGHHICYCLLSSRQQRKMWDSCCNARPQTSVLQTYGLLRVLTLIW